MTMQQTFDRTRAASSPLAEAHVRFRPVMSRREAAVFAILVAGALVLTVRYAAWWFHVEHLPANYTGPSRWLAVLANVGPFAALTLLEGLRVLQMATLWVFAAIMRSAVPMAPPPDLRVAVLTTIVPSKEPLSMLEQTLEAMTRIRSPAGFDIWVLDEEDNPEVKALCSRLGAHHFSRHGVQRYNQVPGRMHEHVRTPFRARTKSGNHNAWRDQHARDYDVVAQMDPDHVPTEAFLEKTLGYFGDPDVAYVVAPQVYYRNTDDSWIARGADEQNFGFSAITQRGANYLGMPIFIGSNHLARTRALDSVRGYASHIVEDHLTGMVLLTTENPATGRRWKGVYTEEIVSYGEGPSRWSSYLSQQLRWSYGLIQILRHSSDRLIRRMSLKQRVGFTLIQSYYPSVATIAATGLSLTTAHLFFGVNAIDVSFRAWLSHWFPQLAISIAIAYWLQRFYLRETDKGWALRASLAGIGATVTYANAMVTALLDRPLSYVITPKGEVGTREPLRLFRWHAVSMAASLAGLAWALWHRAGAPTIMFWAVLNVVLMAGVIGTGVLIPQVLRTRVSWRWFDAVSGYHVRVAVPLVLGAASFVIAATIPDAEPRARLQPPAAVSIGTPAPLEATSGATPESTATSSPTPAATPLTVVATFLEPGSGKVAFGEFDPDGALGVPSALRHTFVGFDPDSIATMRADVLVAADEGQVSLLSWEPRTAAQQDDLLRPIADGQFDDYLREAARVLRDSGQPAILRLAAEMDLANDGLHPWAGQPPADFIAMWRHVHEIFAEERANNVWFAWTPGGYFVDGVFVSDDWYPGDDVVDLVGFTAYAFWEWEEWDEGRAKTHAFRSPEELLRPRYDAVARHGKPVLIPELGIDLHPSQHEQEIGWLIELIDLIDRDLPQLVAVVYFHAPHNLDNYDIDWRLDADEQRQLAGRLEASPRIVTSAAGGPAPP